MSVVCRMCLHQIYDKSFVSVDDNSLVKDQLTQCIPEMIMTLVTNPIICTPCTSALEFVYNFKSRCLQMERRILDHLNGAAPAIDATQLVDILYASLNREIKCEISDVSEPDIAQENCLTTTYCSNDEILTSDYARDVNNSDVSFESTKLEDFKPCLSFFDGSSVATMEDDTTEIFANINHPGFEEHHVDDSCGDSNKPWKNGIKGKHKGKVRGPDIITNSWKPVGQHILHTTEKRRADGRRIRTFCSNCYKTLQNTLGRKIAKNRCTKVSTFCKHCPTKPHLCRKCFEILHV